jgi:hypothetical protein
LPLTLPADGSRKPFVLAGKFGRPSATDKDAVIEVYETTAAGPVLGRKSLMVRIRKNVNALTAPERDRFLRAMKELCNRDEYLIFQETHRLALTVMDCDQAHRQPGFLPWHRVFLTQVERALQAIDLSPQTGSPDQILNDTFSARVEQESHDLAHAWNCGFSHSVNPNRSAADPLFYLLHSQVDRRWAFWQERHGRTADGTADLPAVIRRQPLAGRCDRRAGAGRDRLPGQASTSGRPWVRLRRCAVLMKEGWVHVLGDEVSERVALHLLRAADVRYPLNRVGCGSHNAEPGLDMEGLKARLHERVRLFLDAARMREQQLRVLEDIVNSDRRVLGRLLEVISNRTEDDGLRWATAWKLPPTKDVIRQELNVLRNPKDGEPVCGPCCCRACPNVSDCRIRPSCWRTCRRWPETCCRTMMGRYVSPPSASSCR